MYSKWAIALSLSFLCGCGSMRSAPLNEIRQLPVVNVSEKLPPATAQGHDYVIHVPAGEPFVISVKIGGSLLQDEVVQQIPIRLSRDLYVYKSWASFDRMQWERSHDLLNIAVSGGIEPGASRIEFVFDIK